MPKNKPLAKVLHFDSYGKRQEKYDRLNNSSFSNVDWKELDLKEPYYFFVPKDFAAEEKYMQGVSMNELFSINSSGVTTSRDSFIIDDSLNKLELRVTDFFDLSKEQLFNKYNLKDTREFKIDIVKQTLKEVDKSNFSKIHYRIFDVKNIYYNRKMLDWDRYNVMKNMLFDNMGLCFMRQFVEGNGFNHIFVSKYMIDNRTFSSSRGTAYFFPLYLYNQTQDNLLKEDTPEKVPNFDMEVIAKIEKKLGMKLDTDLTPEDLLDYIYAVLHSKSYREIYKEFLKIDFPRVPFDVSKTVFRDMVKLGRELRSWHLLESENLTPRNFITSYPEDGDNLVEKIKYTEGKVFINDTQYFDGVPENIWEFYIGGYQPAQKWLKDRKGRNLEYEDIVHYGKIILTLSETIRIMSEIENVFEM